MCVPSYRASVQPKRWHPVAQKRLFEDHSVCAFLPRPVQPKRGHPVVQRGYSRAISVCAFLPRPVQPKRGHPVVQKRLFEGQCGLP